MAPQQTNEMKWRSKINYYVLLFSALQFLFTLYYNYDISKGLKVWETTLGSKYYPAFKFGSYTLFACGLIFHCISKPVYRGTSGFPLQYIGFVFCLLDLAAFLCFFIPLFHHDKKDVFGWIQFFIYLANLISCTGLTIVSRKSIQPAQISIAGSWVLSRRRDWGICGTILGGLQVVMIFWETVFSLYAPEDKKALAVFKDKINEYRASMILLTIGALGYHIVSLKISKGQCPCHNKMRISGFVFLAFEIVGLILYEHVCTIRPYKHIFFYHVIIMGLGIVISGLGNDYISRRPFKEDYEALSYQNVDSINSKI
ncbi:hypothetical protein GPJ56_002398 [Histomonas meleagridis]|uniref:uncharacterized protein n=1 Tax=Histomonas meleagridis TaxID=135588 RepID=UPI00355A1CF1|nr:hypothetical protein GPJ56_002398 [Histomonas meleagridis]KAH0801871.1 hypothetical protein GO595_005289 [Histomonas meleagridis]